MSRSYPFRFLRCTIPGILLILGLSAFARVDLEEATRIEQEVSKLPLGATTTLDWSAPSDVAFREIMDETGCFPWLPRRDFQHPQLTALRGAIDHIFLRDDVDSATKLLSDFGYDVIYDPYFFAGPREIEAWSVELDGAPPEEVVLVAEWHGSGENMVEMCVCRAATEELVVLDRITFGWMRWVYKVVPARITSSSGVDLAVWLSRNFIHANVAQPIDLEVYRLQGDHLRCVLAPGTLFFAREESGTDINTKMSFPELGRVRLETTARNWEFLHVNSPGWTWELLSTRTRVREYRWNGKAYLPPCREDDNAFFWREFRRR